MAAGSARLSDPSSGNAGTGFVVSALDQSVHRQGRPLAMVLPESPAAPAGSLPLAPRPAAVGMKDLFEPPTDSPAERRSLQVRMVLVTEHGLHVRFNQAIDPSRLDARGLVVLRGDVPLAGRLLPDPDGEGFRFVTDSELLPGEYRVLLRAESGAFVLPGGEPLDGDRDGRAGGDFRGRVTVHAPDVLSLVGGWGGALSLALGPLAARRRAPPRAIDEDAVQLRERCEADGRLDFAVQAPRVGVGGGRSGVKTYPWEIRL